MKVWLGRVSAVGSTALVLAAAIAAEGRPELSEIDQLLVRAQKICPVSGAALDSMGGPVKADSGGRTIFLCCRGCLGKSIPKDTWGKVTANLVAAQGKCPVMGRSLPANAASVVVNKRAVFVCCKPCIPKVEADPDKYLAVVDASLKENLKAKESNSKQ